MKAIDEWLQPELPEDKDDQLTSRLIARQVEAEYKEKLQEKLAEEYRITKEDKEKTNALLYRLKEWKIWTTIAAALFACFIGLKILVFSDNPSTLAMAFLETQDYFHPGSSKGVLDESTVRDQIQRYFNEQNYSQSTVLYAQIAQPTDEDRYYNALALMLSGKPLEAIPIFETLLPAGGRYTESARWYKAISYMLADNRKEAMTELEKIKPAEWNYALAKKYIRKLN